MLGVIYNNKIPRESYYSIQFWTKMFLVIL